MNSWRLRGGSAVTTATLAMKRTSMRPAYGPLLRRAAAELDRGYAGSVSHFRTLPSAMTSPPSQHHCTRPPSNCSL